MSMMERSEKIRNPLAQALGLVLQNLRDKMGGISSSEIANRISLASSHYRMIEAGSAILQASRAIKVTQTFETIEFVPLCQVLVAIQILDSARDSVDDMKTIAALLSEANPAIGKVFKKFDSIWDAIKSKDASAVAQRLESEEIVKELEKFLTTAPASFSEDQINNFMTPTYRYPISGQLYSQIGNILQGVAPFYLDTILQLIDNLKGITPRVTADELARWESAHKTRITHIIGIVRNPEIILNVDTFDYGFLWKENFQKLLIIHRDNPGLKNISIRDKIVECLKKRFEAERIKYERELDSLEKVVSTKLEIKLAKQGKETIDKILTHKQTRMNNLWVYIMNNGYVVPFIDKATTESPSDYLYGTSLAYDETCEKLTLIKELCRDAETSF